MKHVALATYIYFRAQIVAVVPHASEDDIMLFSPDFKLGQDDTLIVVASDIAVSEEVLTLTREAVITACTGGEETPSKKRRGSFFTRAGEFLRRASEARVGGSLTYPEQNDASVTPTPRKEHSRYDNVHLSFDYFTCTFSIACVSSPSSAFACFCRFDKNEFTDSNNVTIVQRDRYHIKKRKSTKSRKKLPRSSSLQNLHHHPSRNQRVFESFVRVGRESLEQELLEEAAQAAASTG